MSAGTLSPTDTYTRSPGMRYLAYSSCIIPSLMLDRKKKEEEGEKRRRGGKRRKGKGKRKRGGGGGRGA